MKSFILSSLCLFSLLCTSYSARPGINIICDLFNLVDDKNPIIRNEFKCETNCVEDKLDSKAKNLNLKCTHSKKPSNSEIGMKSYFTLFLGFSVFAKNKKFSAQLVRDLLQAYGAIILKAGCKIRIEFSKGDPTPSTITITSICV